MTNEEKINLRERSLRLVAELYPGFLTNPALLQNRANETFRFLSIDLDDDPFKLATPSPAWRHESEMSPEEYWRLHSKMQGIDWSRPQLVKSKNGRCVVEVNTKFSEIEKLGEFSGKLISGFSYLRTIGCDYTWSRKAFEYHGEIPQEPKTEDKIILQSERNVKRSNLSIADAVRHASIFKGDLLMAREGDQYDFDVLKINHRTGEIQCIGSEQWFISMPSARSIAAQDWQVFTLDEKIPEEPRMESKTTGLNFLEATLIAKNSRARIGRLSYKVPLYFELSQSGDFLTCTGSGYAHSLSIEDILATDWQIVNS